MQPHESGALFGHAQRDAQRERAPGGVSLAMQGASTARESRDRQPTVIIRVPLVLEASCEL